jgi:hypothetical protein
MYQSSNLFSAGPTDPLSKPYLLSQRFHDQKVNVLKKREDFAISLRKKKHDEIVLSKRKSLMLKSFSRTIAHKGDEPYTLILDESTLLATILNLDLPPSKLKSPDQRLLDLRGIRHLTVSNTTNYNLTEIVEKHTELTLKLFGLVTCNDMQMTFSERSECLWILTNISCNPNVSFNMLSQMEVYQVIQTLYRANFVHEESDVPQPLEKKEIEFLEQLMWFTANIAADCERSQADAIVNNIDYLLGVVIHNYHKQFNESIWRIATWCLSIISIGLQFIKDPHYDVFEAFLLHHYPLIESLVLADPSLDDTDKETLRLDVLTIVSNVIKNCSDERIKIITAS